MRMTPAPQMKKRAPRPAKASPRSRKRSGDIGEARYRIGSESETNGPRAPSAGPGSERPEVVPKASRETHQEPGQRSHLLALLVRTLLPQDAGSDHIGPNGPKGLWGEPFRLGPHQGKGGGGVLPVQRQRGQDPPGEVGRADAVARVPHREVHVAGSERSEERQMRRRDVDRAA